MCHEFLNHDPEFLDKVATPDSRSCLFCGEVTYGHTYSPHVGRHMEEIAFSVVSKPYEDWSFYSDSSGKPAREEAQFELADAHERHFC